MLGPTWTTSKMHRMMHGVQGQAIQSIILRQHVNRFKNEAQLVHASSEPLALANRGEHEEPGDKPRANSQYQSREPSRGKLGAAGGMSGGRCQTPRDRTEGEPRGRARRGIGGAGGRGSSPGEVTQGDLCGGGNPCGTSHWG